MSMKFPLKYLLLPVLVALLASCGPSRYTMYLELRSPSKVGVDLVGKNISVVYVEDNHLVENGFKASMAEAFATSLEKDYGIAEGSIGIFKLNRAEGADYSSRDSLTKLIIDTGADMVFLFDSAELGKLQVKGRSQVASPTSPDSTYIQSGTVPFTLSMYSFDAMDSSEEVRRYGGSMDVQPSIYTGADVTGLDIDSKLYEAICAEGVAAGETIAQPFAPQWKTENLTLTYYDSELWIDALEKAYQFDWKGAMDIWFTFLGSHDAVKRACAAYNISISCYVAGDYQLAEEWLDLSDKDSELPMSATHRKRIQDRR